MRNFVWVVLSSLSFNAMADSAVMAPGLPIGVSLNSSASVESGLWQQVVLSSSERPDGLTLSDDLALAQLHLGTGTDVFGVYHSATPGSLLTPESYWLRYTLAPTSYSYYAATPWEQFEASPVSGELWISFVPQSTDYLISLHFDKVIGRKETVGSFDTNWLYFDQNQAFDGFRYPANCVAGEDCGPAGIRLSFLSLNRNGSGFDLVTSAVGFDEAFSAHSYELGYGARYTIAPVPLPTSIALLFASCAGLLAARRIRG